MKYSAIKNIIIATLATIVFYSALIKPISIVPKVFGLVVVFLAIWSIFENTDRDLTRRKPRVLTEEQFAIYKGKIAVNVEGCRAQGKDEEWLKRHIINYISHDPRKIFTGSQISELLSLAKENKKSASDGNPNALK